MICSAAARPWSSRSGSRPDQMDRASWAGNPDPDGGVRPPGSPQRGTSGTGMVRTGPSDVRAAVDRAARGGAWTIEDLGGADPHGARRADRRHPEPAPCPVVAQFVVVVAARRARRLCQDRRGPRARMMPCIIGRPGTARTWSCRLARAGRAPLDVGQATVPQQLSRPSVPMSSRDLMQPMRPKPADLLDPRACPPRSVRRLLQALARRCDRIQPGGWRSPLGDVDHRGVVRHPRWAEAPLHALSEPPAAADLRAIGLLDPPASATITLIGRGRACDCRVPVVAK